MSLFWGKFNEKGAIASMITGFLSVPLFKFGFGSLETIGIYFEKLGELGPSFVLAIIVGVLVSKFSSKNKTISELNTNNSD